MTAQPHYEFPEERPGTERSKFMVEGQAELDAVQFPLFVDGEAVEHQIIEYFRPPEVQGYYRLGRVRVTVELLGEEG